MTKKTTRDMVLYKSHLDQQDSRISERASLLCGRRGYLINLRLLR
jgi:hypothetical protein